LAKLILLMPAIPTTRIAPVPCRDSKVEKGVLILKLCGFNHFLFQVPFVQAIFQFLSFGSILRCDGEIDQRKKSEQTKTVYHSAINGNPNQNTKDYCIIKCSGFIFFLQDPTTVGLSLLTMLLASYFGWGGIMDFDSKRRKLRG
jgi:hypothetical protein